MSLLRAIAAVIVGIGLTIGGIVQLAAPPGEVKCGSQIMSPGDTCETTRRGVTTERTYEEQASSNTTTGWVMLGLGPLVGIGGAVFAVSGRRRRTPRPAAPAPAAYHGPPQGYPQQGGQPQHGGHPRYGAHPPGPYPQQYPQYPQQGPYPPPGPGGHPPQGHGGHPPYGPYPPRR